MKLVKGGLVAALAAAVGLMFGASSALAGPIGGPFWGWGWISMDGGLGGTVCNLEMIGWLDDEAVDEIMFTNCTGGFGTPWANNLPWDVDWRGGDNGAIAIDLSASWWGGECRYISDVPIAFDGVDTVTLRTVSRIPRYSGHILCPSSVSIDGTYEVTPL